MSVDDGPWWHLGPAQAESAGMMPSPVNVSAAKFLAAVEASSKVTSAVSSCCRGPGGRKLEISLPSPRDAIVAEGFQRWAPP